MSMPMIPAPPRPARTHRLLPRLHLVCRVFGWHRSTSTALISKGDNWRTVVRYCRGCGHVHEARAEKV